MWSGVRFPGLGLAVSVVVLVASPPAVAAPRPVSGKLSKPGYTVIALAADGEARVVRASQGSFRLRPPAKRVTLHLRAPNGTYAGPVVAGRKHKGRLAIVGVKVGARLGRVSVRAGYASLRKRLRKRWVDASRTARARRGVPIGARNFGRVRSRPPRRAIPGDRDLDGIPDPLDIDDDGDLVLDDSDRSNIPRASQVNPELGLFSALTLPLYPPPNANAPGSSDPQLEALLPSSGQLAIRVLPGGPVELDCGAPVPVGLRYCAPGGTGSVFAGGGQGVPARLGPEFPECCDGDSDGFGTLTPNPLGAGNQFLLRHGATSTEIKSGQVLIEHVATGGDERLCPPPPGPPSPSCASFVTALQGVWATVAGLKAYSDMASPTPNSATVYPVGGPPPGPGGPGTPGNGFPVRGSGPSGDGDVVLTLTFWRPQRRPIGEGKDREACLGDKPPCKWIDIGGQEYRAIPRGPSQSTTCPQEAYSSSDLTPLPPGPAGLPGLRDGSADGAANPNNTVTYTLNVSRCLAAQGLAWPRGEELGFTFRAEASSHGDLEVTFRRE